MCQMDETQQGTSDKLGCTKPLWGECPKGTPESMEKGLPGEWEQPDPWEGQSAFLCLRFLQISSITFKK